MVQMFGTLLSQWSTISFDARVIIETLPENSTLSDDELYNITHEYFGKYLANGLSLLANLPDSWEKTFGGISTLCSISRVSLMSSFQNSRNRLFIIGITAGLVNSRVQN